ncbi:uncharacterized protein F4822DRAFT_73218 [Hypoxylon trugodes]|uniref:uncharacterized protein n=1 Tax=Hypoxylon trugodes TaxID=326681 RepID=UPI0021984622|nr:uncharacterized protein F4822DRAFT_73218 [Hypoxylon trugodes]KAI1383315.1 hypothetical protein F4822DRAFT_73218 [Hypoxylon trugodes]
MAPKLISTFVTLALFASVSQSIRYKYSGCFDSPGDLTFELRHVFQSPGLCGRRCETSHFSAFGLTNSSDCLCGYTPPTPDNAADEEWCNQRCPGYAMEYCGGEGFYTIYLIPEPDNHDPPNGTLTQGSYAPTKAPELGSQVPLQHAS